MLGVTHSMAHRWDIVAAFTSEAEADQFGSFMQDDYIALLGEKEICTIPNGSGEYSNLLCWPSIFNSNTEHRN